MLIIAHRGASGLAPENTLAAMDKAIELGACAIELDVHNVEGELIVIHDRWLKKTTNGTKRVDQYSLDELHQLDAGQGEQIPTLWQVLVRINARCDLNIELKGRDTGQLVLKQLKRAEQELGYNIGQFLVSSFHHPMLAQVKQARPELKIAPLIEGCPLDYARFAEVLEAFSVNISIDFIDPAFIADAKKRGLRVYVFTVNEEHDMDDLAKLGVDGVFTNFPCRARDLLKSQRRGPGQAWC